MTRNKTLLASILLITLSLSISFVVSYSYAARDYEHIVVDGRDRSFIVRIPDNYSVEKQYPLVLAFHGGGGNARLFESRSGLTEIANQEEFIVCYPNGNGRIEFLYLTWNAGYCCEYALEQNIDDVNFVRELLIHLEIQYSIDTNRIYATGMSNGGIFTHRLGAEMSERFAAIAPVAGSIGGYETRVSELYLPPIPNSPLPVFIIHGVLDTHVAYEGGHAVLSSGSRIDLSVKDTVSFWASSNGADLVENTTIGNLIIYKYVGNSTRSDVLVYVITDGIHIWPGEPTDPLKAFQASQTIWAFFANHTR